MVKRALTLLLIMLSLAAPTAFGDVLIGRHKVRGTTPEGSSYRGRLDISIQDGVYLFRWYLTSGEVYDGRGKLEGDTLTIEWGDTTPVIYKVGPNGVLRGTWGGGRGTETATPEKATIARNKKSSEGDALADARKNCERYDQADVKIQACTQLIAKNAKDLPDIYTRRGNGYRMKKDNDRAFADYDKAIELDPNYALAYHQRGFTHAGKNEHDRAIADYDKALKLRPDFIGTFEQRAKSYTAKGDYDRAIADYDTALAREPGVGEYLCGRADVFAKKGDTERAKADYQKAQMDPEADSNCAEEGLARLAAAGPAGAAQQVAQGTKCVAGATAVASGEIIQINPPGDDRRWSLAVNDSENSTCEETILVQFAPDAAPPQPCSVGNVANASGNLVDDGEGYAIVEPADLRCSPPPRADPPSCANGARATVSGAIKSAKLSGNTSGPRSFNISLRRWTQTGECSVGIIYFASEAADCIAGAQIQATGAVEADALLGATMSKVETFTCGARSAPGTGTEAAAPKGPTNQPAVAQSQAAQDCAKELNIELTNKIAACTELIAQDAKNAAAYRNRGFTHAIYCSGNVPQCDLAIADFSKWIELEPKGPEHAKVLEGRGTSYKSKGDKDQARADFSKAIEIDPTYAGAYLERALLWEFEFRDYNAAVADYDKVIQLRPGESRFYGLRARAYQEMGDYKRAISDIEAALAISADASHERTLASLKGVVANPDDAATECAAELSYALGVKACSQLIEKNPNDADAYIHRANLQRGRKQMEQALADYDKAIELDSRQPAYFKDRARLHSSMNAHDKQLADLSKVIELEPKNAESYAQRATAFSESQMFDKAVADWTKAIKLSPSDHNYLCDRAGDYAVLGDANREQADMKAAEKLSGQEGYCED